MKKVGWCSIHETATIDDECSLCSLEEEERKFEDWDNDMTLTMEEPRQQGTVGEEV